VASAAGVRPAGSEKIVAPSDQQREIGSTQVACNNGKALVACCQSETESGKALDSMTGYDICKWGDTDQDYPLVAWFHLTMRLTARLPCRTPTINIWGSSDIGVQQKYVNDWNLAVNQAGMYGIPASAVHEGYRLCRDHPLRRRNDIGPNVPVLTIHKEDGDDEAPSDSTSDSDSTSYPRRVNRLEGIDNLCRFFFYL
jgi:hypothetical protein